MAILKLKEVAGISMDYSVKDPEQMFWDYFAMHELWSKLGSGAPEYGGTPSSEGKAKYIDYVYYQVAEGFASLLLIFIANNGININEEMYDDDDVKKVAKRLGHALKMKDYMEIYAAINDLFYIQEHGRDILKGNNEWNIYPSDLRTVRKMTLPRFLPKVSPLVARFIKGNLQHYVGYDKTQDELTKDQKVINAPRIDWTPEEVEALLGIGLNVIADGNAASSGYNGPKVLIHYDKLKDGTYLFYAHDKSSIEIFGNFKDGLDYVIQNYGSQFKGRGKDARYRPPTPIAPPKPVVPPKPTITTPTVDLTNRGELKRLTGGYENLLSTFGYKWSDADQAYKNEERGYLIKIYSNNSAEVVGSNGKVQQFGNLGLLFRQMAHNKNKRHAPSEPVAQVTEAHYRDLFNFLYC